MEAYFKKSVSAEVEEILQSDEDSLAELSKDQLVASLLKLIKHTKSIQEQAAVEARITGQKRAAAAVAPTSTGINVEAAVQSLVKIITSQIKSQLVWKPSCKTGKAMWKYEGVCPSPEVFKALMGGDIKFKRKKITSEELRSILGGCYLSKDIRYDTLSISDSVNVTWDVDTLEFKFSGTYGK